MLLFFNTESFLLEYKSTSNSCTALTFPIAYISCHTLHLPISNVSSFLYTLTVAGLDVLVNVLPFVLAANSIARSADTASDG